MANTQQASSNRPHVEALEPRVLLSGSAFYADAALTTPGLTGAYVDQTLNEVTDSGDWRTSQAVAGTRVDSPPEFTSNDWGSRASVGLTGGSDSDWESFSVQWDGYLDVTEDGQRFATVSDDGSRFWIDLNLNGTYEPDELTNNHWGDFQGATTGDRTGRVAAGVYPIRIQYYEQGGANTFAFVESPYVPQQFVAEPTNPVQVIRVIVLNYDPRVPGEQNQLLHEVFGWSDPYQMAQQFEADLKWATGGAIDIQIVEWRDIDGFPTFTDGFRYTPDEYVANRRANSGWHDAQADFYQMAESQDLVSLVNDGVIDEIWTFGDHYFNLFGEAWMAGPNAFFVNGPTFTDIGFDRAIAGYGFSYERGVAEMLHNLCHRTENHGQRAFGSWNLAYPDTAFDWFSANYLDTAAAPYGVGSCHVPANADAHYDYADPRIVDSIAFDFANYPNMTWQTTPVGPDTWAMGASPDYHRDYMNWYFAMMPRNDGVDGDGRAANWSKYIWDFNSYESGTGLPRDEDAFGSGPLVDRAGAATHSITVRYYDQNGVDPATVGLDDVRIATPSGAWITPHAFDIGSPVITTAGTARTITYQITPPGGDWTSDDSGTYRIELQPAAVRDLGGNAFADGQVGQFRVDIFDPATINIAAMLTEGQAAAQHTTFDIGPVGNLFDNNTGTLVRTPAVNPATVTLEFVEPQAVEGFSTYFSHAWGDPAYEYTIEAADSLADLNSQTGSYAALVPSTSTAGDRYDTVVFGSPHTASVFCLTATRLTGDDYVHINEWRFIGTAADDADAPVAALASVGEATRGQTAHFIDVTFTDATALDVPSIDNGDLTITGPGGLIIAPTFYGMDDYTNGDSRTATFWFEPPDGAWDYTDNGVYTISLNAGAVRDVLFNTSASSQVLGTFTVAIEAPRTRPPADLAELNADEWIAWADSASAATFDDAARTIAGSASVRFETDGGFDTALSFPARGEADWDLTSASELAFSIYAENPSPYNFQEGPWVRLYGVDGGYFEYRYTINGNSATPLNDAIDQWASFAVPLDPPTQPTGWQRTVAGEVDLAHIASVEFHADTWDAGFTLWLDGVGFDLPPAVVGRHAFYNGSAFDGGDAGASAADDAAIAMDKQALLPDEAATFDHLTSYSRGINGIMVDVDHPAGLASSSDFVLKTGSTSDPSAWSAYTGSMTIDVRPGDGIGGSDRIALILPDHAIENAWLQVTVLSDAHGGSLGLADDDVFYFGNLVGETGDDWQLTEADSEATRTNQSGFNSAAIDDLHDHNRDGRTNVLDIVTAQQAMGQTLTPLTAPAASPTAAAVQLDRQAIPTVTIAAQPSVFSSAFGEAWQSGTSTDGEEDNPASLPDAERIEL